MDDSQQRKQFYQLEKEDQAKLETILRDRVYTFDAFAREVELGVVKTLITVNSGVAVAFIALLGKGDPQAKCESTPMICFASGLVIAVFLYGLVAYRLRTCVKRFNKSMTKMFSATIDLQEFSTSMEADERFALVWIYILTVLSFAFFIGGLTCSYLVLRK